MLNRRSHSLQNGFSLVELMIGVVILAILSAVAIPSFQSWLLNTQIRNAAESISNGLQRARSESVGRNTDIEFALSADSTWVVRIPGGADIETRSSNEGSKSVAVTFTPPGTTTVTYNGFGGIKGANADTSAPFTRIDVDSTELSTAESQNLAITIGLGGNVRMCDPNAPGGSPRAC
ncbi:MAG: GspH/FimT family pseudopilin [Sideroxydans sp.]